MKAGHESTGPTQCSLRRAAVLTVIVAGCLARARAAGAGCNTIPTIPLALEFDGARGYLSRAFAPPSSASYKEPLEIGLRACDFGGTLPANPFSGVAADYLVTIAFKPVGTGPAHLRVLASGDCTNVPTTCASGLATNCTAGTGAFAIVGSGSAQRVRIEFPSTTDLGDPEYGLAGPAAIAVTRRAGANPVPCELTSQACDTQSATVACIDQLFTTPCGTQPDPLLPHFTALPPVNKFQEQCRFDSPPCTPFGNVDHSVAIAVDAAGNLLIPFDWQGISPGSTSGSKRRVEGWTQHRLKDVALPSTGYAASTYTPEGKQLSPTIAVVNSPKGMVAPVDYVDSDTYTIVRVPRCSGGTCKNFDFADEAQNGAPVIYSRESEQLVCEAPSGSGLQSCKGGAKCGTGTYCKGFVMEADARLVPKSSSRRGSRLVAFVTNGVHHKGPDDGDPPGRTLELHDAATRGVLTLGTPSAGERRRRGHERRFALADGGTRGVPPVSTEGNLVAFLAPNTVGTGRLRARDAQGARLRVLERVGGEDGMARLEERATPSNVSVDPASVVNDESLVVSRGLVFFRAFTAAGAVPTLDVLDLSRGGDTRTARRVTTVGSAGIVAVADGTAVYLAGAAEEPGERFVNSCALSEPAVGGRQQIWRWSAASGAESLEREGVDVGISARWIAARVVASESRRYELAVHPTIGGAWHDTGEDASAMQIADAVVAFSTPSDTRATSGARHAKPAAQGRLLRVYDIDKNTVAKIDQEAEDFVLSPAASGPCAHQFVAFRTSETAAGRDLNGDGDTHDAVLRVYDVTTDELLETAQAAIPCTLDGCDPRLPYRIVGGQVRFLTRECDQGGRTRAGCDAGGTDMNGDGDAGDLIVQVYDVCAKRVATIGEIAAAATVAGVDPLKDEDGTLRFPSDAGRCVVADASAGALATTRDDLRRIVSTPSTCITSAACGPNASCAAEVMTMAIDMEDSDGDGIPDGVDPAPSVAALASTAGAKPSLGCRLFPWCSRCRVVR